MGTVPANEETSATLSAVDLLDPARLAALLGATAPGTRLSAGIGICYDHRKARPGDVFLAWHGSNGHGVRHADAVIGAGAAYLLSDEGHPRALLVEDTWAAMTRLAAAARSLVGSPVIGVTGSAGKTTVKTLLTAAVGGRATPGNLNTVPPLLAAFVEAARSDAGLPVPGGDLTGNTRAPTPLVIELGVDRPGEMEMLTAFTRPDHGVLTTIGESHLSRLGSVASVAREKSRLLADAPGAKVAGRAAAAHLRPELLARTHVVSLLDGSPSVRLPGPAAGEVTGRLVGNTLSAFGLAFELPWPGRAMAENALLVLTTAWLLGVDLEPAFERMTTAPLEKGRLRRSRVGAVTLIDDSYNSNPLSAALALEVLGAEPGPRVAFLGDMRELGDVSRQRHLELGEATRELDVVVAIGPEAQALLDANPQARHVGSWREAVGLLDLVPDGAAVLVKGSRSLELENLVTAITERFVGTQAPEGDAAATASDGAANGRGARP